MDNVFARELLRHSTLERAALSLSEHGDAARLDQRSFSSGQNRSQYYLRQSANRQKVDSKLRYVIFVSFTAHFLQPVIKNAPHLDI